MKGLHKERKKRKKAVEELMRTPGGQQWLRDHVGEKDLPKGVFMKREIKSLRNPHFEPKEVVHPLKVKDLIRVLSALIEADREKIAVVYDMESSKYKPIKSISVLTLVESREEEYEEPAKIDKRESFSAVELGD